MNQEFNHKKIVILGMARSGIAAAELLIRRGAEVTVSDQKTLDRFDGALDAVIALGAVPALGADVTPELLAGKDLLLISPGVPINAPAVLLAKEMGIPVLGELEVASRLIEGTLVAVTGTNGKTTTVSLLGEIFEAAGHKCYVCGNIGYPMSAAALHAGPDDVIVAEVSSFQLETIQTFHPLSAAVLNVTEDHLNRHGTMEVYTGLKKHIFVNQTAADVALLNLDDPGVAVLGEGLNANVWYFSRKQEVEQGLFVRDGQMIARVNGQETFICKPEEIYIPGPHNLENALAAAAIAFSRGVPAQIIREVLRTFKGVEHRIEFVRELEGVRYINDSKGTNTDSTIKAVEAMTRPTTIILGGYDKHVSFVPLAKVVKASPYITACVLIGVTAPQIEREFTAEGIGNLIHAETLQEAVEKCRALSSEGSNVLLSPSCASFDMFSDYEQRGRVFKQIVNNLV